MAKTTPDRIERSLIIPAPRDVVWEALTDAKKFGEWFHVKLRGDFAPGETIMGSVEEDDYHGPVVMDIGEMDSEKRFSWEWHPGAIDSQIDYSVEPKTRVEFRLEDAPGGTHLFVTESGFTEIPPERRDAVYRMNYEGWGIQISRFDDYIRTRQLQGRVH